MNPFADLMGGLATPPSGRSRRISSNEQPNWNDGNFDMTPLTPGQELALPVLDGPGVIRHIWLTSHAGGMGELDALSLRIYWDGREEPGVEVPLGAFFAIGQGRPAIVESVPVQVSTTGALTCYWRMPFARSARIVIRNDNPNRTTGLYWQVDWEEVESLPAGTPYFHAQYRQEHPARMGQDYLIADIEGCGRYVGTVMSITLAQDGWFGEGDDFFYIDGEAVPSLQGTGTEDYFNDAWGFRQRTGLWFGQPRWQGWSAGDSGVCYRWHVMDPVCFERSLKVTIEHKGNRAESEDAWYIERPDFLSSVAFWYQDGRPKTFGQLPPFPERCVPWVDTHLVTRFQAAHAAGVPVSVDTTGMFGGRPTLAWKPDEAQTHLVLPFEVGEEGRYAARLVAFAESTDAKLDVDIDDARAVTSVPVCPEESGEVDLLLGVHALAAGTHTLTLGAAAGSVVGLERLRLLRLPPEATRELRTDNEAHFYRLGIGRAAFAYRLAYGELPESLEAMVERGLMADRYLRDENGHPLESRREDGYLVVRSMAPGGWEHRWQGLDARR